jgi:hypothetical protein
VHMIRTDRPFDDRDVTPVTQLNKYLFQTGFYLQVAHRVPQTGRRKPESEEEA